MNTDLLRKIQARFLAKPSSLDMSIYASDCGSVCCIAGMAVQLTNPQAFEGLVSGDMTGFHCGAQALDLDPKQAVRLFSLSDWPTNFGEEYERYDMRGNLKGIAEVTSRRIDHFIATEGRE